MNNSEAPNCRIKYGDNIRALVTYLNVVQCIQRIAELISDLSGRKISEGTVQNILRENSAKSDAAYEEIRKRIELSAVVGADETGVAVGKQLHWNWIFQSDCIPAEVERPGGHRLQVSQRTAQLDARHRQAPELFQDERQEPSGLPGPPVAECRIPQRTGHETGLVPEIHTPDRTCH